MQKRCVVFVVSLLMLVLTSPVAAQITFSSPGFANEQVVSGFIEPVGFLFAPDGRMFVWERYGKVKIVKNGVVLSTPFVDVSGHVNRSGDRGLLGVAIDPDFATNGYVYLAYVYEDGGDVTSTAARTERVTRIQADPNNNDSALPGETVILGTKSTLPCNSGEDCLADDVNVHTIDHLAFGPDGKLWLSAGDGSDWRSASAGSLRAQDKNSLNGKVLRMNSDGTALSDNPFYDGTNSPLSKVYAYGLRNPFRYTFGPSNELIVGDVGWAGYEEINSGRGKNFGWPCYEGAFPQSTFQSAYAECRNLASASVAMPNYYYAHVPNVGGCIIMGPYLQSSPYPAQYNNQLYFADFSNKWLKRATVDPSGNILNVITFATALDSPVFLAKGPDGNLYWLSIKAGTVYRIRFTGSANRAPSARLSASPASGLSPLPVNFSSAGSSDPDLDPLTYLWNFGDGATSISPNPQHQYAASGVKKFTATLTVKDTAGATGVASTIITVGSTPPKPTVATPLNNATAAPGALVNFNGSAFDSEDGNLPGSSLLWSVILHHSTHSHLVKQVVGTSGSFTADLPDTIDAYWYELTLQATDSTGVKATTSIRTNLRYTQGGGLCTLKTTDPSVTICAPAAGATVSSPVRIVGGTTNSAGVTAMKVYIDNVQVASGTSASIDTTQAVATGTHKLTVQSWDKLGRVVVESRSFTSGTPGACAAKTINPSITVCSPLSGATVKSPVHFLLLTTNSAGVTRMKIYVDSMDVYTSPAGATKVDTNIALASGAHHIVVQSWDKAGRVVAEKLAITVSP